MQEEEKVTLVEIQQHAPLFLSSLRIRVWFKHVGSTTQLELAIEGNVAASGRDECRGGTERVSRAKLSDAPALLSASVRSLTAPTKALVWFPFNQIVL